VIRDDNQRRNSKHDSRADSSIRSGFAAEYRQQQEVDRKLRNVSLGLPRTGLPLDFNRRLRSKLAVERERRRQNRRCRLVMQIYWALAAVASLSVLVLIQWPDSSQPAARVYLLGALLGAMLITPLVLLLRLHVNLMSLLVSTVSNNCLRHNNELRGLE